MAPVVRFIIYIVITIYNLFMVLQNIQNLKSTGMMFIQSFNNVSAFKRIARTISFRSDHICCIQHINFLNICIKFSKYSCIVVVRSPVADYNLAIA